MANSIVRDDPDTATAYGKHVSAAYVISPSTQLATEPGGLAASSIALTGTVLTAGVDTSLTFASQVRHVWIQNKSNSDIYVEFDATATVGSLIIPGGAKALAEWNIPCTVLHVFCAAALAVNGTADANLVVKGWA